MIFRTILLIILLNISNLAQKRNFIKFTPEDGLSLSQVSSILQNNDGTLAIATYGGGLNVFDGKEFIAYYSNSGLCDNTINCLLKDNAGNIWIGTEKGLSKFDGKSFSNYYISDGLPSNSILNLSLDKKGNILIATYNGFSIFDGNKFISFSDSTSGTNTLIWSICNDSTGKIWLGIEGGVIIYDGKNFVKENFDNLLSDKQILSLYKSRDNKIWIGTQDKIYTFYKDKIITFKIPTNIKLKSIWSFFEDSVGSIWVSTYGNVIKITGNKVINYGSEEGLNQYQVWSVFEDRENNMWFGTDDGLYMLRNDGIELFQKFNSKIIDTWTIKEDYLGTIWVGTEHQNLLYYKNGKFFAPKSSVFKKIRNINTILIDKQNTLWFGANNGVVSYNQNRWKFYSSQSDIYENDIVSSLQDSSGRLWFGSTYDGLYYFSKQRLKHFDAKNSFGAMTVYALFQDKRGRILLGTDRGIKTIKNGFIESPKEFKSLEKYSIINIISDSLNNLWIGTYENGIYRFQEDNNKFDSLTIANGLNDISVLATVLDKESNLWIGTNKGINKFYLNKYLHSGEKKILSFNKKDGFLGIECIQNASFCDSKGNIWFGTVKGLLKFDPRNIKVNITPPMISISNVEILLPNFKKQILDKNIIESFSTDQYLKFPYDNNNFEISFNGINLTNPSKVKYSYRLNNSKWTDPITKNKITLSNLQPGKYIFEAKAANDQNIWSTKYAKFNFDITTPFWRKTWFLILSSLLIMGIVYLGFSIRVNQIKKMNRELEERIRIKNMYEQKLRNSQKELKKAKEAAEQSDKLKSEFLAQMSHEVRTPINSILSFTTLIYDELKDNVDENLQEGFEIINNSSRRLIRTIDSILNMSRIQTGNIDLQPKNISLVSILNELLLEFTNLLESKNLKLIKNFPKKDVIIKVDEYTITQLFANLIDNAIKYTKHGFIKITVHSINDTNKVIIEDTGIGMTKEFLSQIFDPFTQEDTGYTRQYEGNGLGLALVKKYCDLNNAKITVQSEKNKGTKFIIEF